ncbi:hypothetical protein ACOSQ2_022615 [Xanthoceras sorbifolium]
MKPGECFFLNSFKFFADISLLFLANIDAAAKEREAAIHEKDAAIKERDALRKNYWRKLKLMKSIEGAIMETKIRAVDRYKKSLAFDSFTYQEYVNGMRESRTFFKDDVAQELLEKLNRSILENENDGKKTLAKVRKLWQAHCQMMKLSFLDMHTEGPPKDGKPTSFGAGKGGTLIMGACSDEGPIPNFDYTPFLSDDDSKEEREVDLTSNDEDIDNKDKSTINTLMKKGKSVPLSRRKVGQSSRSAVKDVSKDLDLPVL